MKLGAANSCRSLCLIQEVSCKLVNPLSRAPLRLRCSKAVRAKCFLMCKCDDGSCLDGLGCDTCTLELGQQHQTLPFLAQVPWGALGRKAPALPALWRWTTTSGITMCITMLPYCHYHPAFCPLALCNRKV